MKKTYILWMEVKKIAQNKILAKLFQIYNFNSNKKKKRVI